MTFAYWTILFMIVLAPLTVLFAKLHPEFDNGASRAFLERQTGWRRRLDWAHRNHYEALPAYAAAVIVANLTGVTPALIDWLAAVFVAARVAYTFAYAFDRPSLRSMLWSVGFACIAALFVAGAAGW
jgi:uncharacterized MAPEG superfamily protein